MNSTIDKSEFFKMDILSKKLFAGKSFLNISTHESLLKEKSKAIIAISYYELCCNYNVILNAFRSQSTFLFDWESKSNENSCYFQSKGKRILKLLETVFIKPSTEGLLISLFKGEVDSKIKIFYLNSLFYFT